MADEDNRRKYRGVLRAFMSYRDGTEYSRDHEFAREELAQVTAQEVGLVQVQGLRNEDPRRG